MGVILFVRHGQASVGAADYDVLSATGEHQSELLGTEYGRRGIAAARIVTGRLNRQRQTADRARRAAEWSVPVEVDAAWDEFDHENVRAVHRTAHPESAADGHSSGLWFDQVIPRWSSGSHDHDYTEPFRAFAARVDTALRRLAVESVRGQTTVVFTSAGVIGRVATALLGGGESQWTALNRVVVNSAVTRVVVGSRGSTLVSFNEYSHLAPELVTYQ